MDIKAKQNAEEIILKARQEIKQEKEKAIEDAKKQIVDLVILSTEKILKEKIDKEKDEKLINQLVASSFLACRNNKSFKL